MKVLVTATLLVVSTAVVFCAPTPKCRVCEASITGEFYFVKDKARGGKYEVCTNRVRSGGTVSIGPGLMQVRG